VSSGERKRTSPNHPGSPGWGCRTGHKDRPPEPKCSGMFGRRG
jgi:hypothetical protein